MNTKRLIAILMSLLLAVGLFAGCSTDTPEASKTPAGNETTAPETDPGSEDDPSITFPLAEPVTFEIWNGPMSTTAGMSSPNDSIAYKEAEKRTNVHIEWSQPAQGTESEQFNLLIVSTDMPDAFMGTQNSMYIGGLDKYINDEIIIDIMPFLEKYGQNFLKMAKLTEDTWKRNITDMGRMPGFYNISKEIEPTWWGPMVREDWLNDFGLNSPVTYNDWYNMLTLARDEKGATRGYALSSPDGLDDSLLAGFNLINGFFAKDGEVKFGPYEPELLDYLTMVNKWYSEGLIDPDFASYASAYFSETPARMLNNEMMAFRSFWTMIDVHGMSSEDPNFQLVAVPAPVKNVGDTRKLTIHSVPDSRVGTNINTITTSCENIPVLVSWFDYFYSDEGEILADYGIEGETFEYDDNGKPYFLDVVINNPDGLSQSDALYLYTIGSFHSRQYDWARQVTPSMSDYGKTAGAIWDSNWDQDAGYQSMLGVTLNETEAEEYSPLYTDITTYITESIVRFVNGSKPLSEFESYREQLKTMGIERCIEIYQQAYERYMAR